MKVKTCAVFGPRNSGKCIAGYRRIIYYIWGSYDSAGTFPAASGGNQGVTGLQGSNASHCSLEDTPIVT